MSSLSFSFNPSSFGTSTPSLSAPFTPSNPFATAPSSTTPAFGTPSTTPTLSLFTTPSTSTSATPATTTSSFPSFSAPSLSISTASFAPFGSTASPTSTFPSFASPSLSTPSLTTPSLTTPVSLGSTTHSLFSAATTPSFATHTASTNPSLFASSATPFASPIASVPSASTSSIGGPVSPQNVIGATKFSELPADLQNTLEKFNKLIIDQKVVAEEISRRTADNIPQIKDNATSLIEKVAALTNLMEVDSKAVSAFKTDVLADVRTVESAYNDSYRLRSPNQFSQNIVLPPRFFWGLIESFDTKLRQYGATIADIESYFNSLNSKKAADPRTLGESIKAQYDIFVAVAERLAVVHDALEDRKEEFRDYRRKYLGDSSNPFEPKKKSVLAPFPVHVSQVPSTPTSSTTSLSRTPTTYATTPSSSSFFSPSGTTTVNAGTALFGTSSSSTPISFASPAATPSSLSFGATTPAPASTFSFATPSTPSTPTPLFSTTPATTPSAFGTTGTGTSYGSTSSFGSGAGSSFGSTASSTSSFGSTASPFGSTASATAAANSVANAQKKNSLSSSQSRNSGRKKSGNRSTSV